MTHGNCTEHAFRRVSHIVRSIGGVEIEMCNNCLSVVVVQKRDTDAQPTRTVVEMKNSAYPYKETP